MTIFKVIDEHTKYYRFIPDPPYENISIEDNNDYVEDCALSERDE